MSELIPLISKFMPEYTFKYREKNDIIIAAYNDNLYIINHYWLCKDVPPTDIKIYAENDTIKYIYEGLEITHNLFYQPHSHKNAFVCIIKKPCSRFIDINGQNVDIVDVPRARIITYGSTIELLDGDLKTVYECGYGSYSHVHEVKLLSKINDIYTVIDFIYIIEGNWAKSAEGNLMNSDSGKVYYIVTFDNISYLINKSERLTLQSLSDCIISPPFTNLLIEGYQIAPYMTLFSYKSIYFVRNAECVYILVNVRSKTKQIKAALHDNLASHQAEELTD